MKTAHNMVNPFPLLPTDHMKKTNMVYPQEIYTEHDTKVIVGRVKLIGQSNLQLHLKTYVCISLKSVNSYDLFLYRHSAT